MTAAAKSSAAIFPFPPAKFRPRLRALRANRPPPVSPIEIQSDLKRADREALGAQTRSQTGEMKGALASNAVIGAISSSPISTRVRCHSRHECGDGRAEPGADPDMKREAGVIEDPGQGDDGQDQCEQKQLAKVADWQNDVPDRPEAHSHLLAIERFRNIAARLRSDPI